MLKDIVIIKYKVSEMELSRYQIRTIIYFQFCCKKSASACHRIMCTALGTTVVSYDTVKVWYRKFKNKEYDIEEAERCGRPTDVDEARLRELVEEDQYATTRELGKELDVSAMSISRAMHRINLTYKFNRWVPHELTQAHKDRRVNACTNLLEYQRKDKILDRIVTCDEKWIYFNNTTQKWGWSAPGEPVGSVAKRTLTNKKIMLCIWWDCRGIIHKEYLEKGKTIDSKVYSEMLVRVDAAIKAKRRTEFRRKKVMFHQDNAKPHVSAFTGWTLYTLEWDLLPHPPYSPDIAPSDFYLFSHLQLLLAGAIFHSAQDVRNEVDLFLDSRPPSFWAEGFEKLPKRWQKIIDLGGDYYPH